MELLHYFFLSLFLFFLAKLLLLLLRQPNQNLPPSPPALPILGHLRLLLTPLHRTLDKLSIQYGPILFLKFGKRRLLVLSSASSVEECVNKNDITFANRPRTIAARYFSYDYTVLALTNYGQHWRSLRRISTTEIFSTASVQASSGTRRDAVRCLLRQLYRTSSRASPESEMIDLKLKFFELTFNAMMSLLTGEAIGDGLLESEENRWFFSVLMGSYVPSFFMVPGDYLPVLGWFDVFKIEKTLSTLSKKRDAIFDEIIEKCRKSMKGNAVDHQKKSILDAFLRLQENDPEQFSDDILRGVILTMFTAGMDTTALTLEWAMSLLLNHPDKLQKACSEINNNIEPGHIIEDSDLSKLPYIHSIILETLRLYPPVPFLVPHESSRDCTLGNYDVPRDTVLAVNAWAIHRDPKAWDEPSKFMPERFANGQGEREGFKFIPFGIGRRGCPGAGMATRFTVLTLGSLLQCFEWKKIGDGPVDLSEGAGLILPKAQPLEALCKPRSTKLNALSQI